MWKYGETEDYTQNGQPHDYTETVEYSNGIIKENCNTHGRTRAEQAAHVSKNRGAGTVYTVPYPQEGIPAVDVPFGYVEVPVTTLEQIDKEVSRRRNLITSIATGQENGDVIDKQSLNAEQVAALNQGHQSVLQSLANVFADVQKWVIDTEGQIRFGDAYEGSVVNNGTAFITLSASQIEENIKLAKEAGANESQLKVLYFMWYDSKFKTEPIQAEKYKILFDVEPFPTHSIAEMQDNRDVIDPVQWSIKLNFNTFIAKFEAEEVALTSFSSEVSDSQKIQSIINRLTVYANELINKQPKEVQNV
jgi:hypothetical protein